jgi:apolipoprotein N-acyltransferase
MTDSTKLPKQLLPFWVSLVLAAAAGLLMDIASPDLAIWPLAFLAVGTLLVTLIGRSVPQSLLLGLIYGVCYYSPLVLWTSRYLGPLPWIALTALEAAITAVLVALITLAYRYVPRVFSELSWRVTVTTLLVASLWLTRELVLGSWPYGGFPWARLGMTQSESPLATVSSWIGVSGLSFLMVAIVALAIELVRERAAMRPLAGLIPVSLLMVMVVLPSYPTSVVGELRIGAVQGNGPTGYFDKREPFEIIEAQVDASAALIGEELDLVVWPEGGVDYDPFRNSDTARILSAQSQRLGAPLLVNAAVQTPAGIFNTSLLWGSEQDLQSHAKRHPVPFGEYIPNRAFFRLIVPDLIDLVAREYSPGTDAPIMTVGKATIGLAICFDVIYDELIREGLHGGAEVLVFQTNNADFRGTDENLQQLAFARMRAIESGRWVVNVSTVGTSQVIAPDGSTIQSIGANEAGTLLATVERRSGLTPGVLLGQWIDALAVLLGLGGLIACGLASRKSG